MLKRLLIIGFGLILALGAIIYQLGPYLFANIAYPLPERYRQSIGYYATLYGVDPNLLAAVIKVESNYNSQAISRSGAMGLTQVIPSTAQGIAKALNEPYNRTNFLNNPDQQIRFGAYYLGNRLKTYGSVRLALIAYNGGGGVVNRYLRNQAIAAETRGYFPKVESVYRVYRELYGNDWWKEYASVNNNLNETLPHPEFSIEPKDETAASFSLADFWLGLLGRNSSVVNSEEIAAEVDYVILSIIGF